ncbi:hypothetical protein [Qipengyuania qiaonensis]|uniref:Uncharacterized protein n=1 Tax=Qipengyuania qiaonensis TaxID=2867240 RepID=A0ABS7JE18_9SPHN|nr:hypothetical protein [Qipengyuania qiaonensis]MBX7484094.1 hypothetical protein [Qipengyuania qiaonensis]
MLLRHAERTELHFRALAAEEDRNIGTCAAFFATRCLGVGVGFARRAITTA